jgi:hypothetical protein
VNATTLTAPVAASAIASAGPVTVTAVLPCGATSAGATFTVN